MPLIVLVCLFLIVSWLFSEVLVFSPFRILDLLNTLFSYAVLIVILSALSWFFGD